MKSDKGVTLIGQFHISSHQELGDDIKEYLSGHKSLKAIVCNLQRASMRFKFLNLIKIFHDLPNLWKFSIFVNFVFHFWLTNLGATSLKKNENMSYSSVSRQRRFT